MVKIGKENYLLIIAEVFIELKSRLLLVKTLCQDKK